MGAPHFCRTLSVGGGLSLWRHVNNTPSKERNHQNVQTVSQKKRMCHRCRPDYRDAETPAEKASAHIVPSLHLSSRHFQTLTSCVLVFASRLSNTSKDPPRATLYSCASGVSDTSENSSRVSLQLPTRSQTFPSTPLFP